MKTIVFMVFLLITVSLKIIDLKYELDVAKINAEYFENISNLKQTQIDNLNIYANAVQNQFDSCIKMYQEDVK
jgi:hypothetical protein